eukprot:GILJ01014991.1.p1 GENE.GILJ01014991.1~~GILJ01014991.1.p1  ORF type:complete len:640 (+),score=86.21 GILJ01014991.1:34-1953(+)
MSTARVLIVGAGPVGLSLARLLSDYGTSCLVIERHLSPAVHPQAHFINTRSMEIFRMFDKLDMEVSKSTPPVDEWRNFRYVTSMLGDELGYVDHLGPDSAKTLMQLQSFSPTMVAHFPQHRLVPLLLKRVQEGPRPVPVQFGHELVSLAEHSDCVAATIKHGGTSFQQRFAFVVGADGAHSMVRRQLGIHMAGDQDLQRLITVHFSSKVLGDLLKSRNRLGMLYFCYHSDMIGVFINHGMAHGEWVLQMPYFPPHQTLDQFKARGIAAKLIQIGVGSALPDLQVKSINSWTMSAQVAASYASANQRVFLVGDAAHVFPPAGAFGMNTGIQDAHNLAWKLTLVDKGLVSSQLLTTYQTERRQIAEENRQLSLRNFFETVLNIPKALGLEPTAAQAAVSLVDSLPFLSNEIRTGLVESALAIGRSQMHLIGSWNPLGTYRLQRIQELIRNRQTLQLLYMNQDIGFRYERGAFVTRRDRESLASPPPLTRPFDFSPSVLPGYRMPHIWLRDVKTGRNISTVDLSWDISEARLPIFIIFLVEWTLEHVRQVSSAVSQFGVPVRVVVLVKDAAECAGLESSQISVLQSLRPSTDDPRDLWNLNGNRVKWVLIRPDGHIADVRFIHESAPSSVSFAGLDFSSLGI